jgi:hypothetical protein
MDGNRTTANFAFFSHYLLYYIFGTRYYGDEGVYGYNSGVGYSSTYTHIRLRGVSRAVFYYFSDFLESAFFVSGIGRLFIFAFIDLSMSNDVTYLAGTILC